MKSIRAILLLALAAIAPAAEAETRKPNVLFIVADDLRGDIGAFGNPAVKTPQLDRLAQRAVRFERAYCQLPWCNPSRVSFLTGLRPDTTRVLDLDTLPDAHLGDRAAFLPRHFKANGYWTSRVGKIYHESKPQGKWPDDPRSWDVSERGHGGAFGKKIVAHKTFHGRGARGDFLQYTVYDVPEEETPEYRLATRGIELLEQGAKKAAAQGGKPFFVAVGFHKPHLKWQMPKKYWDLYDPAKIPLAPEPPLAAQKIPPGAGVGNPQQAPLSDANRREAIAAYYACISYIDAQIGRLLDSLDRLGVAEQTIVVVIGDHGYNLGEHGGAWEKVKLWEDTCRTPLLIAAPGCAGKGQPSRRIVEFIDIFPTLVDLCALPPPVQKLAGVSLRPLLEKPDAKWERPAFTLVPQVNPKGEASAVRGRSIRTERWRYTEWGASGQGAAQFYDHAADPHEFNNLAADPQHAATGAELSKLLREQAAADAAAMP